MAVWVGDFMLAKHICGATYFISWINDKYDLRCAELIGGQWWIGNTANTCKCGIEIGQFDSKKWSEA